jgi:hypothetical protein
MHKMELERAEHCRNLDAKFYGLARNRLMQLAFDFAEMNGLSDRFNAVKRSAGKGWVVAFCKRQGLTLQQCSIGRAIGFNTAQVTLYFKNLKTCCERNKFLLRDVSTRQSEVAYLLCLHVCQKL